MATFSRADASALDITMQGTCMCLHMRACTYTTLGLRPVESQDPSNFSILPFIFIIFVPGGICSFFHPSCSRLYIDTPKCKEPDKRKSKKDLLHRDAMRNHARRMNETRYQAARHACKCIIPI